MAVSTQPLTCRPKRSDCACDSRVACTYRASGSRLDCAFALLALCAHEPCAQTNSPRPTPNAKQAFMLTPRSNTWALRCQVLCPVSLDLAGSRRVSPLAETQPKLSGRTVRARCSGAPLLSDKPTPEIVARSPPQPPWSTPSCLPGTKPSTSSRPPLPTRATHSRSVARTNESSIKRCRGDPTYQKFV